LLEISAIGTYVGMLEFVPGIFGQACFNAASYQIDFNIQGVF